MIFFKLHNPVALAGDSSLTLVVSVVCVPDGEAQRKAVSPTATWDAGSSGEDSAGNAQRLTTGKSTCDSRKDGNDLLQVDLYKHESAARPPRPTADV
jgi:hypothetical protein